MAEIPPPPPLKWSRYVSAVVVAYLIPWLALLLHAVLSWRRWGDYPAVFRHALVHQQFAELSTMALWALIPGAVTFLVLAPFLRFPVARRLVLLLLGLAWFHLASATDIRGTGNECAGSGGAFHNDMDRAWSATPYAFGPQSARLESCFLLCTVWPRCGGCNPFPTPSRSAHPTTTR